MSDPLSRVSLDDGGGAMWLFTVEGFLSVVQHRDDHDKVVVRARNRTALESISEVLGVEIKITPTADYPCRVIISKDQMANLAATFVREIDYDNFKNAAHSLGDDRYDRALMQVWSAMYESSPADARGQH